MADQAYVDENNAERERLRRLVEQWSDDDLRHPMPAGWTVAAVMAHMAFWDARANYFMKRWEGGAAPSAADDEDESDWINDSSKPLCLALEPRAAADLALRQAEEADRRVAALPDDLVRYIRERGQPFNLSRAEHRREHLDEIEQQLSPG